MRVSGLRAPGGLRVVDGHVFMMMVAAARLRDLPGIVRVLCAPGTLAGGGAPAGLGTISGKGAGFRLRGFGMLAAASGGAFDGARFARGSGADSVRFAGALRGCRVAHPRGVRGCGQSGRRQKQAGNDRKASAAKDSSDAMPNLSAGE